MTATTLTLVTPEDPPQLTAGAAAQLLALLLGALTTQTEGA